MGAPGAGGALSQGALSEQMINLSSPHAPGMGVLNLPIGSFPAGSNGVGGHGYQATNSMSSQLDPKEVEREGERSFSGNLWLADTCQSIQAVTPECLLLWGD